MLYTCSSNTARLLTLDNRLTIKDDLIEPKRHLISMGRINTLATTALLYFECRTWQLSARLNKRFVFANQKD